MEVENLKLKPALSQKTCKNKECNKTTLARYGDVCTECLKYEFNVADDISSDAQRSFFNADVSDFKNIFGL